MTLCTYAKGAQCICNDERECPQATPSGADTENTRAPAGGSEPTEEMLAAAERVTTVNRLTIIRIYQAMLAASPEVCASGSGERETDK